MAQMFVEGTVYKVTYANADYNTAVITFVGGYDSPTIWSLAEGLIPCIKSIWFSPSDVVRVATIQSTGDTLEITK